MATCYFAEFRRSAISVDSAVSSVECMGLCLWLHHIFNGVVELYFQMMIIHDLFDFESVFMPIECLERFLEAAHSESVGHIN